MNTNTDDIVALLDTPVGQLAIKADDMGISSVFFKSYQASLCQDSTVTYGHHPKKQSRAVKNIIQQLTNYFVVAHNDWSLESLVMGGSKFQHQVWRYLQTIPLGETRTYSQVADALVAHHRPVANACKANPFALIVPCHRVVSVSGIGGYGGYQEGESVAVKKWLLHHERL